MARFLTLGALVTRCQRRCDMEHDDSISTDEWKEKISEVYGELCSLVAGTGLRYFESTSTITAIGATSYPLPADHLSTVGIDLVYDAQNGLRRQLVDLMAQERSAFGPLPGGEAVGYMIVGQTIRLLPVPPSGTYELLYIPQPADIASEADGFNVDLIVEAGQRFLIWGVAVIAKDKSESELVVAMRERDRAKEDLVGWAATRAITQPRRHMTNMAADDYPYDPDRWWAR